MFKLSRAQLIRCRGIIVWDFDGVLFETKRQSMEYRRLLGAIGITEEAIVVALKRLEKKNRLFSITGFIEELNHKGKLFPAAMIRKIFHNNLVVNTYYDSKVDAMLHRLKRRGFIQLILSLGNAQWQRKKMFVGCGSSFPRHFARIYTTRRPKHFILSQIKKRFPDKPVIFVDDTEENLNLAKKHVPELITVYYSNINGHSLDSLEKRIISYVKQTGK